MCGKGWCGTTWCGVWVNSPHSKHELHSNKMALITSDCAGGLTAGEGRWAQSEAVSDTERPPPAAAAAARPCPPDAGPAEAGAAGGSVKYRSEIRAEIIDRISSVDRLCCWPADSC